MGKVLDVLVNLGTLIRSYGIVGQSAGKLEPVVERGWILSDRHRRIVLHSQDKDIQLPGKCVNGADGGGELLKFSDDYSLGIGDTRHGEWGLGNDGVPAELVA